MPTYLRNTLTVYGSFYELKYFYEHNRVTEEDIKYMNYDYITDLSFEKSVSHSILKVMNPYIQENYSIKNNTKLALLVNLDKDIVSRDLMYNIWGTTSNALNSKVDLEEINNGFISYTFNSEFGSPHNWLICVSQIFPKLRFQITYSDEYDNHEEVQTYEFKNGIKTHVETYNSVIRCVEENGGIENVVHMIIQFCINNNIMISDENDTIHWCTYCKNYIEKNKENDGYENDLLSNIIDNEDIYNYIDENKLHHSLYTHNELCVYFVEKVKHM